MLCDRCADFSLCIFTQFAMAQWKRAGPIRQQTCARVAPRDSKLPRGRRIETSSRNLLLCVTLLAKSTFLSSFPCSHAFRSLKLLLRCMHASADETRLHAASARQCQARRPITCTVWRADAAMSNAFLQSPRGRHKCIKLSGTTQLWARSSAGSRRAPRRAGSGNGAGGAAPSRRGRPLQDQR
jgi:hypothetical protein